MAIVISDITTDVKQLSGLPAGYEPSKNASVWFWPYEPWHVEDGTDDFLVSGHVLKRRLVDGVDVTPLPETPVGNAVWVQLRGVKGYGSPWLVEIPATDANLFDLPHIDPDTLDPLTPPSPAWLSAWQGTQDQLDTTDANLASLTQTVADLELGAASDTAVATQVEDGTLTGAAVDARIASGITGKANAADVYDKAAADARYATTAQGAKADAAATNAALLAEIEARDDADQTLAQVISDYADTLNTALGAKITAPTSPADGYQVAWNNTLGAWVAVAPSGGRLVASAVATSGAVAIPGNGGVGVVTAIPNTSISVTNSAGLNIALRFNATFIQTVAGTGSVYLVVKETTSGANTDRCLNIKNLPGSLLGGMSSVTFGEASIDIGVVTTTRTFDLKALVYAASGTPAVNILSSTINPTSLKAFST